MRVLTMGVEEEFLLVEATGAAPCGRAPQVIATAAVELGDQVQAEFYTAQVEVCSTPAADLESLRADLARLRRVVRAAAAEADCRVLATGTPPVRPARPLAITDCARYGEMARRFAALIDGYHGLVCGTHVHIGTLARHEALALAAHLRPWLPALQSLTGNSPFAQGCDTGFESWRSVEFARWPTVGPTPVLCEQEYEHVVSSLVRDRILLDRRMVYWYARPSEHVPTVEIRIADANADLDTVVLLAALVRGLSGVLLVDVERGVPAPVMTDRLLRSAHKYAAAHGLDGAGLDPVDGQEWPAGRLVDRLVERAAPALEATGDLGLVQDLLRRLREEGSGAARQRAAHRRRGSLADVVDALAATTAAA
ncbi:carboxylate-amine ligase [Streptomyces antimicrobicus]|uniref:Putative glutamate--cysteine ligase 2 n=1 Tax=Streptomyces antimicrobicus TaxID=2883108 RepID=A0ABS8B5A2_9ACTN|nr:glutamate--cysteine ligase [Streptomyces antimicrobicus]MCB5179795.1 glutamate--cysteine ligase [Streptomyces antimicrobicus]